MTKIIEKFIYKRQSEIIEKYLMYNQVGFRPRMGTAIAIDRVMNTLKKGGQYSLNTGKN